MIDLIFEPIAYGLGWVLYGAWRAVPLLAIVLILDLMLRRRIAARFHCLLWALVMLRMLCPISIPSTLSLQGHFDRLGESILEYEVEAPAQPTSELKFDTFTFEENGKTITLPVMPADATAEYRAEAEAYVASLNLDALSPGKDNVIYEVDLYRGEEGAVEAMEADATYWDWESLLAIGIMGTWLLVAFSLLIRSCVAHRNFARRLKTCPLVTDHATIGQLTAACRRLHVRRVPAVKEVEDLSVPAVFGIWRHTICLPNGSSEQLSSDELDWVLMHETAHIKRRDTLLLSAAMFVRALQWFNPFAHLTLSRLRHYMEQAADDLATRGMPDRSVVDYGRLLLRYAAEQNAPAQSATVGLLFVSSSKSLRRRIEMLDRNRRRNHWLAKVAAVAAFALVVATGWTDAKTPEYEAEASNDSEESVNEVPEFWRNQQPAVDFSPPPLPMRGPVTEVTYDVRDALQKLAEEEPGVDPEVSLKSLFQLPLVNDATEPKFEDGKLTIEQSAEAHQLTRLFLRSIEQGGLNRQVSIELRVMRADPAIASAIDWTGRGITATRQANHEDSLASEVQKFAEDVDSDFVDEFVLHASDESVRSRPMLAVKISEQQMRLLMHRANQDADSNMMFAPKVTLFSGQIATISDESRRPFVTGIQAIEGGLEPIIETVNEGWRFRLYSAVTEDDSVDLSCVLTESELKSVEQASLPFLHKGAVVQVPNVAKTTARSSVRVANGESLLIISPDTFNPKEASQSPAATFYLLTPRVIVQEDVVEHPSEIDRETDLARRIESSTVDR